MYLPVWHLFTSVNCYSFDLAKNAVELTKNAPEPTQNAPETGRQVVIEDDMWTNFYILKFTFVTSKREKRGDCWGPELPSGERMENPDDNMHKNVCILELSCTEKWTISSSVHICINSKLKSNSFYDYHRHMGCWCCSL